MIQVTFEWSNGRPWSINWVQLSKSRSSKVRRNASEMDFQYTSLSIWWLHEKRIICYSNRNIYQPHPIRQQGIRVLYNLHKGQNIFGCPTRSMWVGQFLRIVSEIFDTKEQHILEDRCTTRPLLFFVRQLRNAFYSRVSSAEEFSWGARVNNNCWTLKHNAKKCSVLVNNKVRSKNLCSYLLQIFQYTL